MSLTLSYSSEINALLCSQRVTLLLKKIFWEWNAAHPVGYNSPLQIKMAVWHTFLKKFELAGSQEHTADYNGFLAHFEFLKSVQMAITIFSGHGPNPYPMWLVRRSMEDDWSSRQYFFLKGAQAWEFFARVFCSKRTHLVMWLRVWGKNRFFYQMIPDFEGLWFFAAYWVCGK